MKERLKNVLNLSGFLGGALLAASILAGCSVGAEENNRPNATGHKWDKIDPGRERGFQFLLVIPDKLEAGKLIVELCVDAPEVNGSGIPDDCTKVDVLNPVPKTEPDYRETLPCSGVGIKMRTPLVFRGASGHVRVLALAENTGQEPLEKVEVTATSPEGTYFIE